jgi:hypothetical protein
MGKWEKVISAKVKAAAKENPQHADEISSVAKIIFVDDDDLKKIFGKSVNIDGTEYAVRKTAWDNRPQRNKVRGLLPCFHLKLNESDCYDPDDDDEEGDTPKPPTAKPTKEDTLLLQTAYWKEPAKKKEEEKQSKQENAFAPIVKLLELPKEEAAQTVTALTGKIDVKKQPWEINNKASDISRTVKQKVWYRLLKIKAGESGSEEDFDLFLKSFIDEGRDREKTVEIFTGSKDVKSLKKISQEKLFLVLSACYFNLWNLPDLDEITAAKKTAIMEWAGVKPSELKEMYKEELKAVLPKPVETKAPEKVPAKPSTAKPKPKTSGAKKPAVKKPAPKKPVAKKSTAAKAAVKTAKWKTKK